MKPLTQVLPQIKPHQKVMLRHNEKDYLYKITVNNNLSGNGLWAIDYSYLNTVTNKFDGPHAGGYFPANEYDVLRVSGRFV